MSVATEIERISAARNTIRDKLVELGLAVSTDTLDVLAAAIEDIVNQGAVQVEILEGTSYTIPAGFHNGSGTVKAMTDVTGEAEKYKVQAKTITPTKNQQSVAPDTGYYALSAVTVNAIPAAYQNVSSVNAAAGDVRVGKIIVTADGKVTTGTMADNGAVTQLLDCTTVTYTIPAGFHNGNGTVSITLEEKSVTPTKSAQTVTPTSGKVLKKVTVNPIPDNYADTTDATAVAENIQAGKTAYIYETDASGNKIAKKVAGTQPSKGTGGATLTPDNASYTIERGYYSGGGTVKVSTTVRNVELSRQSQQIEATGAFFNRINVPAIPANLIDTTDADAVAGEIVAGKFAYVDGEKVEGTMPDNGAVEYVLDRYSITYPIPKGYHNGQGAVHISPEGKTVTPTKEKQVVLPTTGKVLSGVTVNPIPDEYIDTTPAACEEESILIGRSAFADGVQLFGTMPNNGSGSGSIDGLTTTSFSLSKGYYNGNGKVSLTNDIETALAAI